MPAAGVKIAQFNAVDQQRAVVREKTGQSIQKRTFAGAALTDQHDAFTGRERKVQRPRQDFAFRRFDDRIARFETDRFVVAEELLAASFLRQRLFHKRFQTIRGTDGLCFGMVKGA